MKRTIALIFLVLLAMPLVLATNNTMDIDVELTEEEMEQFDEILAPVVSIYNFVKYVSTLVAAIVLVYAGISFMISSSDPRKRDQAKNIAMYVVIGLIVIWGAPTIIGLLV